MRVLLCVHHGLSPDQGAPGTTLALGAALERHGHGVGFLGFDEVFGPLEAERVSHQVRFPWAVARTLIRRAEAFDVVDASTGDTWVWASLGRPRARSTALVTRAHGLEHVADRRVRDTARGGGEPISWKYPIYHGGLRLWEVRRTLRAAEQCILLNEGDRDFVRDNLGVPAERLNVIPNAVAERFHGLPAPEPVDGPLRLAFIGRWSTAKGKETLVATARKLADKGIEFQLGLFGTAHDARAVLPDFPEDLRGRVSVTPRFANESLPRLLAGRELFVFPSLSEGSSGALLEAMACGLAPVATPVGTARTAVAEGAGIVSETEHVADAVARLAADRAALLDMRRLAHERVARYTWDAVAQQTAGVYERAVAARSTTSRKRAPTEGQL